MAAAAAATVLVGVGTAAAYLRFSYPKIAAAPAAAAAAGAPAVGACRVRFRGSVAAQVFYPTAQPDRPASYPLFRRPDTLAHMAAAVKKPLFLFQMFGLDRAATPAVTATGPARGAPPPPVAAAAAAAGNNNNNNPKLPVVVFSHGLYGHCDVHAAMSCQLARRGYVVVVLEHEGRAASYARTEVDAQVLTYKYPPDMSDADQQGGHAAFLRFCRDFRRPILEQREREIARVVQCLRGHGGGDDGGVYPLRGETGLPFGVADDVGEFALEWGAGGEAKAAAERHCRSLLAACDPDNLILVGHSFGGATAVLAAQSELPDLRGAFRCCVLFDPWTECLDESVLDKGLGDLPVFSLLSGGWIKNNFYHLTERLFSPKTTRNLVWAALPGTLHQWVADTPCWFPWWLSRLTKQTGDLEPGLALARTVEATLLHIGGRGGGAATELAPHLERLGMVRLDKHTRPPPTPTRESESESKL